MPDINLKAAPQREVLDISRRGSYGAVEYCHRLTCGHTEIRKRKAAAKYIACTLCAVAIKASQEMGELAQPKRIGPVIEESFLSLDSDTIPDSRVSSEEVSAAVMTADLAAAFKIPNEMISVVYNDDEEGNLSVAGATVWLDPESIRRILEERRRSSGSGDEHRIRRPLGQQ